MVAELLAPVSAATSSASPSRPIGTRESRSAMICARGVFASQVRPELAYIGLLSKSHAPHLLLKADGTRPVQTLQII